MAEEVRLIAQAADDAEAARLADVMAAAAEKVAKAERVAHAIGPDRTPFH